MNFVRTLLWGIGGMLLFLVGAAVVIVSLTIVANVFT